jgi:hypothetical protein
MAIAHGRRVVAVEVFGNHDLLLPHWEALVRSHLTERPTADGYPSATRVLHRIRRFAQGLAAANRGVGLGQELHVNDRRTVGQALVHKGAIVHASGFMVG